MKTLYLSSFLLSILFNVENAFSQLTVSTQAETRNVLLEEYTGPVCGSCPYGHKKAYQIISANPDNVFEMRIIDEGFSFSSFDLSLSVGDTLEKNAKLIGFPQATINRKELNADTMAIFVSDWNDATTIALTENAYVNIAAKGSLNMTTRQLSVEVKAYFTGNGTPDNKINIALLQSHISGMQFGNDDNHRSVLPNGEYEHNHILRHLITGQWGEPISTTSQGTLYHNTFYYTLPQDINSIPLIMQDIEILAFVSEGKNEIINVTKADIEFNVPNSILPIDIELTSSENATSLCDSVYEPSVTIKNNGTTPINQFIMSYSLYEDMYTLINLGSETFNITIPAGGSHSLSFPQIPVTHTISQMGYDIEVLDSNRIDLNSGDDWFTEKIYILKYIAGLSHVVDFDQYFAYWSLHNAIVRDEFPLIVGVNNYYTGAPYEAGAYGNSLQSILFDYYNTPVQTQASIQFDKIDFSIQQLYGLTFSHAYAQRESSSNDRLQIEVTTDCGDTWASVYDKSGTELTTTNDLKTAEYVPALNEWQTTTVNLSAFAGYNEVSIKITGISDHGNALFFDDLSFGPDATVGINNYENNQISLYPNPSSELVSINLVNEDDYSINLINTLGQVVMSEKEAYGKEFSINISELEAGVYFVNVKTKTEEFTSKFIKE